MRGFFVLCPALVHNSNQVLVRPPNAQAERTSPQAGLLELLFRLRNSTLDIPAAARFPSAGILLLRFFVRHISGNDHRLRRFSNSPAWTPLCFRRELHRINHSQNFIEVAAGAHRIGQHQLDLFIRPDNEHGAHGSVSWPRVWPSEVSPASAGRMS